MGRLQRRSICNEKGLPGGREEHGAIDEDGAGEKDVPTCGELPSAATQNTNCNSNSAALQHRLKWQPLFGFLRHVPPFKSNSS